MVSIITRLADGGSERRLLDVLDAFPDVDHVVLAGEGSSPTKVAALAASHEVHVVESLVRQVDPVRDQRATVALRRHLRGGSFDAVFTHQSKAGLLGRVLGRAAGVPRIYHSASMASFGPGYRRAESTAFALAERSTAPLVDRYFVVGSDLALRLRLNGVRAEKLTIVRSSIELGPFRAVAARDDVAGLRRSLGLDPEAAVICFVGSLDDRKGAPGFVDLVRAVRSRLPDRHVQAIIAGDGPHRATIDAQLANDPALAPDVVRLGHTDRVAEVMAAADVLVLASSAEGLPQVLVQAASAGLPYASYDIDGTRELAALGATGATVAVGDQPALVRSTVDQLTRRDRPRHAALDDATLAQWSPERVRARYRAEILPEGPAVGTAAAEPGVAATGPADLDGADRPRPDA